MPMPKQVLKMFAVAAVAFAPVLAHAGVLGTNVTGGMYFGANPTNYFNSSAGFVPGGCQNSGAGSSTVTVVDPTTEFCFQDGSNFNTAQFTDTTLSVSDMVGNNGALNWTMTFAFAPGTVLGVSETSDMFDNGGVNFSFLNDVLTLTWAGTSGNGLSLNAQYLLEAGPTDVPEPTPLALLALAMLAFGAVRRTGTS